MIRALSERLEFSEREVRRLQIENKSLAEMVMNLSTDTAKLEAPTLASRTGRGGTAAAADTEGILPAAEGGGTREGSYDEGMDNGEGAVVQ